MRERPVLCSASNETYVVGLAVALCSALRNLTRETKAPVMYVLDGGIRERSWLKVEASVRAVRPDCVLRRLRPDMATFAGLPHDWGSSVMAYARLALPAMVPEERILYFDSDLIVQRDLAEVWGLELGEAMMAAALDITAKDLGNAKLPCHELGLPPTAPCLNSGLMLMDLPRWRNAGVSAAALRYLRDWPGHATNWDQSALNVVLHGHWHMIETTWNTPAWLADQGKEGCKLDAAVLHFVGPHKPWLHGYHESPSAQIFYDYVDRTVWKGWRPTGLRQVSKAAKYRAWKLWSDLFALTRKSPARPD